MDDITRTSADDDGTSGILRITPTIHPPGVRLEGELDRSGMPAVRAALTSAAHRAARGDDFLHTDLGGLDFVDVGGLRVLIGTGLDAGGGAVAMRMVAASAAVRRLLTLTGWDAMPGRSRATEGNQAPPAGSNQVRPGDGEDDDLSLGAGNTGAVDGGG